MGCDLALHQCAGYIFLWTAACHISGSIESVDRCLAFGVYPVTAGGMTTYDVRLGSLNFHVLLTWIFPGFHPLEGLSRRHV